MDVWHSGPHSSIHRIAVGYVCPASIAPKWPLRIGCYGSLELRRDGIAVRPVGIYRRAAPELWLPAQSLDFAQRPLFRAELHVRGQRDDPLLMSSAWGTGGGAIIGALAAMGLPVRDIGAPASLRHWKRLQTWGSHAVIALFLGAGIALLGDTSRLPLALLAFLPLLATYLNPAGAKTFMPLPDGTWHRMTGIPPEPAAY